MLADIEFYSAASPIVAAIDQTPNPEEILPYQEHIPSQL